MNPGVNKTTLDNGVRIITKKMPDVRSVSMGVWVNAGSRDEADEENGLSHLIEHMIFKGTRRRTAYQIAKEFDAIGGHTNAFTSLENTCYHAKVMDTHLPQMVDILCDILMNSEFDSLELDRERPVILQEIGMVEDNPDEYVHVLSGQNFWGDHPLGRSILGTRENIQRFDADTVKRFFSHFYQPDRIVISAAGNLDHHQFIELAAGEFEKIGSGNRFPERVTPRVNSRVEIHTRDIEQVHLCLLNRGLSITHPRRYAFSLMNTVLGGNMSSRLFQEIRERRGLAYAVYSFVSSFVDTGMFGVYAGVSPDKVTDTIGPIVEELRKIKNNPIEAEALKDAKEYTKGSLLLTSESNENQMVRLAQNEIHFGRYKPMAEILDRIDRVTAEDILELARDLFGPESLGLTILGPIKETPATLGESLRL